MKSLNVYELNDGLDGVIVAKSIKQAIKIIAPYYGYTVNSILSDVKNYEKDRWCNCSFAITDIYKMPKKKSCRKSKLLGWRDC